jgi:hypothetical protein
MARLPEPYFTETSGKDRRTVQARQSPNGARGREPIHQSSIRQSINSHPKGRTILFMGVEKIVLPFGWELMDWRIED